MGAGVQSLRPISKLDALHDDFLQLLGGLAQRDLELHFVPLRQLKSRSPFRAVAHKADGHGIRPQGKGAHAKLAAPVRGRTGRKAGRGVFDLDRRPGKGLAVALVDDRADEGRVRALGLGGRGKQEKRA